MTTPVPTQADRDAAHRWMGRLPRDQFDMLLLLMDEGARRAERATREACARAIEQVKRDFLSEEYAVPQPIGSIQERFACDQCLAAIRNTENTDDK